MNNRFPSPAAHTTAWVTTLGQPGVEEEIKPTLLSKNSQNKDLHSPIQEHAAAKPGSLKLLENEAKQEIMSVLTAIVVEDSNKPGYFSMETRHQAEISEQDIVPTLLSHNQEEIVLQVLKKWTTGESHTRTAVFQKAVSEVIDSQKQSIFPHTSENDVINKAGVASRVEHREDVSEVTIPYTENQETGQSSTTKGKIIKITNNDEMHCHMDDLISFDEPTPTAAYFQLTAGQLEYTPEDHNFASGLSFNQIEDESINNTHVISDTSSNVFSNQLSLTASRISGSDGYVPGIEHFAVTADKANVESSLLLINLEESSPTFQKDQHNEVKQIVKATSIVTANSQLSNVLTTDEIHEKSQNLNNIHDMEQVTMRPKPNQTSAATGTLNTSGRSVHTSSGNIAADQVVMRSKTKEMTHFRERTDKFETTHHPGLSSVNNRRSESMIDVSRPVTASNRLGDIRKSFTIESKSLPPLRQLSALRPLSASTSDLSRLGGEQTGRPASGNFSASTFTTRTTKIDYPKTRQSDGSPFQVDVLKGIAGIGLKVKVTSKGQVKITDLQTGGPVEKNGHVKVGDYLVFVNSTELTGQTDARVQQVLRLLPRGLTKLVITCAAPTPATAPRTSPHDRNPSNVKHLQRLPQASHQTSHSSNRHTHISVSASQPGKSEVISVSPVKKITLPRSILENTAFDATESKHTDAIDITKDNQAQRINLQSQSSESEHGVERPIPAPRHNYASKENNEKTPIENNEKTPIENNEKTPIENTSSQILQVWDDLGPVEIERLAVQKQLANQEVSTRTTHCQGSESSKDTLVPHAAVRVTSEALSKLKTDSLLAAEFIPKIDTISLPASSVPSTTQASPPAQDLNKKDVDKVSSKIIKAKDTSVKDVKEVDTVSSKIIETKDTTVKDVKEVDLVSSKIIETKDTTVKDVKEVDTVSSTISEAKKATVKDVKVDLVSSTLSEAKKATVKDVKVDKVSSTLSETKKAAAEDVKKVEIMYSRINNTKKSTIREESPNNIISTRPTVSTSSAPMNQPNTTKKSEVTVNRSEPSQAKPQRKISAGYERLQSITGKTKSSAIIEKSGTFVSSTAKLFDQKAAANDEAALEHTGAARRKSLSAMAQSDRSKITITPMNSIKERWQSIENNASFKQPEPFYLRTRSTSCTALNIIGTLELSRQNSESDLSSPHTNSVLSPKRTTVNSFSNSTSRPQAKNIPINECQSTATSLGRKKENAGRVDTFKAGQLNLHKTGYSDIYKSSPNTLQDNKTQERYSFTDRGKSPHAPTHEQSRMSYVSSVRSSIPSSSSMINDKVSDNMKKLDELLMDSPYQRTDTHPHDVLLCLPEVKSSLPAQGVSADNAGNSSKSHNFETVNNTKKLPEFVKTFGIQPAKSKTVPINIIHSKELETQKVVINKQILNETKKTDTKEAMDALQNTNVSGIREDPDAKASSNVKPASLISPEVAPPSLPRVPPPSLALSDANLMVDFRELENVNESPFVSEIITGTTTDKLENNYLSMSSSSSAILLDVDTHAGELLVTNQTTVTRQNQSLAGNCTELVYTPGDTFPERDDIRGMSPSPVDMLSEDSGMPADEDQEVATDDAISPPGELAENSFGADSIKNVLIHSDIEAELLSIETKTGQLSRSTIQQDTTSTPVSKMIISGVPFIKGDEKDQDKDEDITEIENVPPPLLPSSSPPSVASLNPNAIFTEDFISHQMSSVVQTSELQPLLPGMSLLDSDVSFLEKQEVGREISVNRATSKFRSEIPERSRLNIDAVVEQFDLPHIKTEDSNPVIPTRTEASEVRSEITDKPYINLDTVTESVNMSNIARNSNTAVNNVTSEKGPAMTKNIDSVTARVNTPQINKIDSVTDIPVNTTASETTRRVINRSTKSTVTRSADLTHSKKQDLIPELSLSKTSPEALSIIREKSQTKIDTESLSGDLVDLYHVDHAVQCRNGSQTLGNILTHVTSKRKWCLRSNTCLSPVLGGHRGVPVYPAYAERFLVKTLPHNDLAKLIDKANAVLDSSSAPVGLLLVIAHLHGDGAPLGVELKHEGGIVFRVSGIKKGSLVRDVGGVAVGDWLLAVDSLWCDQVTVMRLLSRLAKPKHDSVLVFAREEKAIDASACQVQESILTSTQDRPTANKRHKPKISEQEHEFIPGIENTSFIGEVQPSGAATLVQDQSQAHSMQVSTLLEQVPQFSAETPPLPKLPPPHQVSQPSNQTPPCTRPELQLMKQTQPLLDQLPVVKNVPPHLKKTPQLKQEMTSKQHASFIQDRPIKLLATETAESIMTSSDMVQEKPHAADTSQILSQEHAGSENRKASVNKTTIISSSASSSEISVQGQSIASAKMQEQLPANSLSFAGPPSDLGPGVHKVMMTIGATGVGFCLEGGIGSPKGDLPITIKRIFKGGSAEKCGLLKVKDEILEVNGLKFSQMGHYEAWNHLKFINDREVHITIRRI